MLPSLKRVIFTFNNNCQSSESTLKVGDFAPAAFLLVYAMVKAFLRQNSSIVLLVIIMETQLILKFFFAKLLYVVSFFLTKHANKT